MAAPAGGSETGHTRRLKPRFGDVSRLSRLSAPSPERQAAWKVGPGHVGSSSQVANSDVSPGKKDRHAQPEQGGKSSGLLGVTAGPGVVFLLGKGSWEVDKAASCLHSWVMTMNVVPCPVGIQDRSGAEKSNCLPLPCPPQPGRLAFPLGAVVVTSMFFPRTTVSATMVMTTIYTYGTMDHQFMFLSPAWSTFTAHSFSQHIY